MEYNGIIEVLTFARSCLFLISIRFSHNIQSYLKATEAESLISAHFHFIQFSSKTLQGKTPYFEANYFNTFFTKLYSYVLSAWFKLFIRFYRLLLLCRSVTNVLSHSFIYSVMNVINIGPVQTPNFSCTDPNPFTFKSTWKKTFESAKSDMSNLGWPMN